MREKLRNSGKCIKGIGNVVTWQSVTFNPTMTGGQRNRSRGTLLLCAVKSEICYLDYSSLHGLACI